MKFIKSKKGLALLATLAVAVVAAVGGYAYFTSTGHGTGSATVGTDTPWTVGQDATGATGGPLYPDAAAATFSYPAGPFSGANVQTDPYTVTNGGSGNQNLTSVTVKVANADGSAWTSGTCSASDFSVGGGAAGATWTDPSATLYGDYTASESRHSSVTVEMVDSGANQNDCRGLTVPLYFFAS